LDLEKDNSLEMSFPNGEINNNNRDEHDAKLKI